MELNQIAFLFSQSLILRLFCSMSLKAVSVYNRHTDGKRSTQQIVPDLSVVLPRSQKITIDGFNCIGGNRAYGDTDITPEIHISYGTADMCWVDVVSSALFHCFVDDKLEKFYEEQLFKW